MICDNITKIGNTLYFAGQSTLELAKEYGTPLYLMDEDKIREKCNIYKAAFKKHFGDSSLPLYASKANSFKYIYKIMADEGMGIDVVSSGEIYTALSAGFDIKNAFFHSNNKTDEDINYAISQGIGYFVADNIEEINIIDSVASQNKIKQKVLLRLTPGIDTHTYEADVTGKVDSKFGSAIETGQAMEIALATLQKKNIELMGFHAHVGSQVFEEDVFERTARIMLEFVAKLYKEHGFETQLLDLGGGYGVRYTDRDPVLDIELKVSQVAAAAKAACNEFGIKMPTICMEPGRSIVADAGMTLYTVGTLKKIPGYKNYVSIDGSMADHIRYALYGAQYTVLVANKMDVPWDMKADVVGRCCESGDIIQDSVMVPSDIKRNDIVAVCTTGAYHYSMASNYNRLTRPPIVMLKGGKSFTVVKRESFEDLIKNDL